MKKILLYFLLFLPLLCPAETRIFSGSLFGLVTNGKSVFSILSSSSFDTLIEIYPGNKKSKPLPPYKGLKRDYRVIENNIVVLSDNCVSIYNPNLVLLKQFKLPDVPVDYCYFMGCGYITELNLNPNFIECSGKTFFYHNLSVTEIRDKLELPGIKIELKNDIFTINDISTKIKFRSFGDLSSFLNIPEKDRISVFNPIYGISSNGTRELVKVEFNLFDTSGQLIASLPFEYGEMSIYPLKNGYILNNDKKTIIADKKGNIVKYVSKKFLKIIGALSEEKILLKANDSSLVQLSLNTFELKEKVMQEKIADVILLNDIIFYIPKSNDKQIRIKPIKDIF